jgi:hypothetical protein
MAPRLPASGQRRGEPGAARSEIRSAFLLHGAEPRQCRGPFIAAALKAGGRDNGQPGVRTDYGPHYYAAFVIDPDGYRIETYCGDE